MTSYRSRVLLRTTLGKVMDGGYIKCLRFPEKKIIVEKKGEKISASVVSEDGIIEVRISGVGAEVFSLKWEGSVIDKARGLVW